MNDIVSFNIGTIPIGESVMNKFILTGRVAKIGFKSTDKVDVLSIQIITSESYKTEGEWKEITDSFFCVMFGKRAKALYESTFIKKGYLVEVQGKMRSKSYEKDGHTIYGHDFVLEDIQLLARTLDEMIESRQKYKSSGHSQNVPDTDYKTEAKKPVRPGKPVVKTEDGEDEPF